MSTVATKPDEPSRKKNERELWLVLIGAAMVSKQYRDAVFTDLTAGDCPFDDLAGFLGGIQGENADQAWSWAKRLGAERVDDKVTIPKAVLLALKKSTLRRVCQNAAHLVAASGKIEDPPAFLELLRDTIKRVEAKL